jgi:hypothetical protein
VLLTEGLALWLVFITKILRLRILRQYVLSGFFSANRHRIDSYYCIFACLAGMILALYMQVIWYKTPSIT